MASSAFWAFGSKIQLGDGATSESFADIAEVVDLVPPAMTKDSIDVTNHSSTNRWKEFIPGMKDGGSVSVKANWLPTNATHDGSTGVLEAFTDNVNHNWKIVLPDSLLTISFTGHITAFNPETPLTLQGSLSFTVKISGEPTFA
jgi:predicted secreted protein